MDVADEWHQVAAKCLYLGTSATLIQPEIHCMFLSLSMLQMTTNGDLNPVAASDNGNILTCTFDRKVRTTVEGSDFDVKRDLYLLVAKGLLAATGYPRKK